jgi:parallel beta-helix repeat protein
MRVSVRHEPGILHEDRRNKREREHMGKLRYLSILLVVMWILASGCDGEGEGLVGIISHGGTECLGEEAQPIEGDSVYVSPNGDDRNRGDTIDAPFLTLAHALCNLQPGQTLQIMPGTYHESVVMGGFGNEDAPMIIRGVARGGKFSILDGEGTLTMGLALVECTNIVIENIDFRNYTDEGLFALLGSDLTIQHNRFIANGRASIDQDVEGEGFGVRIEGTTDVSIVNNEVVENGPSDDLVMLGILGTGIDTFELKEGTIRDNYVHDNIGGGILVEDGGNVLVVDNWIDNNKLDAGGEYWDGAIWVDGGQNITLRGNVITNNLGPGIQISDEDVQYPDASLGYIIEGNTITGNLYGIYLWNFGVCPSPEQEIISFLDNTIEGNIERDIWCLEWPCGAHKSCE